MQYGSSKAASAQTPSSRWLAENGPRELETLLRSIVYHPSAPILSPRPSSSVIGSTTCRCSRSRGARSRWAAHPSTCARRRPIRSSASPAAAVASPKRSVARGAEWPSRPSRTTSSTADAEALGRGIANLLLDHVPDKVTLENAKEKRFGRLLVRCHGIDADRRCRRRPAAGSQNVHLEDAPCTARQGRRPRGATRRQTGRFARRRPRAAPPPVAIVGACSCPSSST